MATGGATVRAKWRARNLRRLFVPTPLRDVALARMADQLKRNGIAVGSYDDVIGDGALFDAAAAEARRLAEIGRLGAPASEKKPFLYRIHPEPYAANDPFARICLHPRVLAIVNRYLGLHGFLRLVDVWLTVPTAGAATETQLWHRDTDDMMVAKLFLYFNDVELPAGPFTYAPGTHPLGSRTQEPAQTVDHRTTDEMMARVVPEPQWVVCTGKAGTLIFADTCGFHKQTKPSGAERLLLTAEYTSGTPFHPREITLQTDRSRLSRAQRLAAFQNGS